jgi:hypothetical protein
LIDFRIHVLGATVPIEKFCNVNPSAVSRRRNRCALKVALEGTALCFGLGDKEAYIFLLSGEGIHCPIIK